MRWFERFQENQSKTEYQTLVSNPGIVPFALFLWFWWRGNRRTSLTPISCVVPRRNKWDPKNKAVNYLGIIFKFPLMTDIPKCLRLQGRRLRFAGGFSSTPLAPWSAGQSRSSRMLISYRLRNHRRNKTSTDEQFPVIDYVLSMQNIASKLVLQGFSRLIGRAASDQWSAAVGSALPRR